MRRLAPIPAAAILLLTALTLGRAQEPIRAGATVIGRILDAASGAPVPVAEVLVEGTAIYALSDSAGRYLLRRVPPGPHVLLVRALGYASARIPITAPARGTLARDVRLAARALEVEELIVVADPSSRARGELGTASVVERDAIAHQTAASLEGVLELIPGAELKPPDLANVQQIALRSVPTSYVTSLTLGGPTAADLASFGTLIILDGVPLSNNANLQTTGPRGELSVPSSAGGGIDLRRVPASTLDRVEVIRGVPSARYGDLTQGVIVVDTRAAVVEPVAAARYDAHILEGSFVMGEQLGAPHAVTGSIDITSNETRPGLTNDKTTRITGQLAHRAVPGGDVSAGWTGERPVLDTRVDYFRVFENNPEDLEVSPGRASRSRDMGLRISERARFPLGRRSSLELTGSLDYVRQRSYRQALLVRGAMPFTDWLDQGRSIGHFIGGEYTSRLWLEGDQWQIYTRVEGERSGWLLGFEHKPRVGVEFRREWNSGPGYRFDVEYPPQVTFNGVQGFDRPRPFDAIPAVATTSVYLDDRLIGLLPWAIPLDIQAGLRFDLLHRGSHWFTWGRDWMLQPRLNAQLAPWPWLRLRGAWGLTAKQPSVGQLYPPPQYYDVVNVNWYANDPAERLAVLSTFIRNPKNPELGFTRGRKAEAGIEFAPGLGRGVLSLVAFSDRITEGVGYRGVPGHLLREHFQLTDSTPGSGVPPEIIEPASYVDTVPILIDRPDNILTLETEGLELTLDLPELRALRTRLNVQAAWIRTKLFEDDLDFGGVFSSFQMMEDIPRSAYWEPVTRTGERAIFTYRLIHHQPQLGLVVTGTIQHFAYEELHDIARTDSLAFAGYMTRSGRLVPVPPERRADPEFADLRAQHRGTLFFTEPTEIIDDWLMSLQVSKTLPRGGRLSFYAFNVLDREGRVSEKPFGSRSFSGLRFGLEVSLPLVELIPSGL
ncbi:MAG: TonB-dependent receptor [Gemmatimonadota bacterium]|nr:MAG: TonB-dependent receptor [Gemmatimonadota bacterium]